MRTLLLSLVVGCACERAPSAPTPTGAHVVHQLAQDAGLCTENTGPGSEEYQAACDAAAPSVGHGPGLFKPYDCPAGHDGGPEEDGLACFDTTYRGRTLPCCTDQ